MSSETSTAPTQHNRPSAENIATGQTTNTNERPFSNTVNGNTRSFLPSTSVHNYQCQHVHENSTSYHGCTIYNGTPAPRAPAHEERVNRFSAAEVLDPISSHPVEPRSPLMPFYWLWTSIRSFIRALAHAAPMSIEGRIARDTIVLNAQATDLEAQNRRANTDDDDDRSPLLLASNPSGTPGAEENV
ncbi:hypothetical protein AAF712_013397 [Marasmius tenuissimus]|uniref:Uncharacterized protein n=1 Tax=Marasmius tenuissimus TaxID=585030 RepID=A0ABR2ZF22_9AGAR